MESRLLPLCRATCQCSRGPSPGPTCVAQQKAYATLQHVFGFDDFRPGQLEAILPALHGRDVFVRMATGAGKSLCMFTVPLAYSNDAVGVIISPLNALMDEQVSLMPCFQHNLKLPLLTP